jgi:signal transduction histidine kinase
LSDQNQSSGFLNTVWGKTTELGKLVNQLMSYSKTKHQSVRRFNVSKEVKTFLQALDYQPSTHRISLNVRTSADEDLCIMDKSMFDSILLELITNSLDAMDETGRIQIIIDLATLDSQTRRGAHLLSQGNYVTIKIKDSGHGISEYDLPNVFEPFFTTRNMGRGLGLSSVQSTIDVNDGAIIIESEYGSGTEVTLWLPRVTLPKIVEISDEDNAAAV